MEPYIKKSDIIAEIEKIQNEFSDSSDRNGNFDDLENQGAHKALDRLEYFLDTLETKEVDLEKEVEDWVKTGPHTSYPWCTIPDAIRITAEHFYELGLKSQKGEK